MTQPRAQPETKTTSTGRYATPYCLLGNQPNPQDTQAAAMCRGEVANGRPPPHQGLSSSSPSPLLATSADAEAEAEAVTKHLQFLFLKRQQQEGQPPSQEQHKHSPPAFGGSQHAKPLLSMSGVHQHSLPPPLPGAQPGISTPDSSTTAATISPAEDGPPTHHYPQQQPQHEPHHQPQVRLRYISPYHQAGNAEPSLQMAGDTTTTTTHTHTHTHPVLLPPKAF